MHLSLDLTFATTTWHVVSAAMVFFIGCLLVVLQYRFFKVPYQLALALYLWHTASSMVYFVWSLSNVADSTGYYLGVFDSGGPLRPGTIAVSRLTSVFAEGFFMSYGGTFLVYNLIGFLGVIALAAVLRDLTSGAKRSVRLSVLFILFLPGLSFWSAAIGKDAITFLAAAIACWASFSLVNRFPAMAISVALMFVARPHIAAVLLLSLGGAMIVSANISVLKRFVIIALVGPVSIVTLAFAQTYVGLGEAQGLADLIEYIADRRVAYTQGGLAIDIENMSVAMRLFSFLYRPLFLDAPGVFGMIITLENIILIAFSLIVCSQILLGRQSSLPSFSWWFMVFFAFITLMVLGNTVSNLGMSMRMKWMFMPMVFALGFSYFGRPKQKLQVDLP